MNARLSLSKGLRLGAAGLTAALLSACGGHSGGGSLPVTQTGSSASATVKFHISLPQAASRTPNSVARHPNYVSAATTAANIAVSLGGTVVKNATLACDTVGRTCDGQISAPVGADTFAVSLVDASANLLSQGSTSKTIVVGAANSVSVTFDPVVASVTFTPATFTLGAPGDSAITVAAQDAAGDDIVGPGTFIDASGNPLTFSATLSAGAVTLLTPGSTVSKPGDTIAVHYSGSTPFYAGTVTPTSSGGITPTLFPASYAIVVVSGSSLTASPSAGAPVGIAVDPVTTTKLWYAGRSGGINALIGSTSTAVGTAPFPLYVAADAANLWFTDWGSNDTNPSPGSIYRVKASDNSVTRFLLPTSPTDYSSAAPTSVIVDAATDAVWFTLRGWGNGGVLPAGTLQSAIGKLAPASGPSPTFTFYPVPGNPYGLTLGPLGKIWYTEDWGNKVGVLDPSLPPSQVAVEHDLGSGSPFADAAKGIAYDGTDLWLCRQGSNQIARVSAGGSPTYYQLPVGSEPKNVIYVNNFAGAGPRIVFTESNTSKIGILDPNAVQAVQPPSYVWPVTTGLTEIALPSGVVPVGLVWDGAALWVTDSGTSPQILKITAF